MLTNCYYYGDGVDQDYEDAVKYYRLAADQGLPAGQFNVGGSYQYGVGVSQNYAEVFKWTQLAAEQGYPIAVFSVGDCYCEGIGVEKDLEEAAKWYQKALDGGYEAMDEEEQEHLVAVLGEGYDKQGIIEIE